MDDHDVLLVIDTKTSFFRPVTEKAKAVMGEGLKTSTHEFILPAQMAHYEVTHGLKIKVQDERGRQNPVE